MGNKEKGETTRKRIMQYLWSYHAAHGYMPSYREIGKALDINSTSTVHSHMNQLFRQGLLQTEQPNSPRAFRINTNRYKGDA